MSVDRLKDGPADYEDIITKGTQYNDRSFRKHEQYYQLPYSGWKEFFEYYAIALFGGYTWRRLGQENSTATLFGDDPTWTDVQQGDTGTCYILAAMAALAEFPDVLKNVFVTQEVNSAGIYAI